MVKDDVLLVAGNFTSVSIDVFEVLKKDVVDSILFSQLYASSKVVKFSDSRKWYESYTEALSKSKWKTGGHKFSRVELGEGVSVVLNSLIHKRLASVAGFPQVEQFERLMNSIQSDVAAEAIASTTEEHAMVCKVEGKASAVSNVVFNVNLVGQGPVIYSVFVCFNTEQKVESNFFHQEFKSELVVGEIDIGISQFVLDKYAYEKSRMREKILCSLPDDTASLVLDITANSVVQVR
jgi:hypothetical protein